MGSKTRAEVSKALLSVPGDRKGYVKFTVTSTLGAHGAVDQLRVNLRMLDLKVTYDRTGGLFSRTHFFEVTGRSSELRKFWSAYLNLVEMFELDG